LTIRKFTLTLRPSRRSHGECSTSRINTVYWEHAFGPGKKNFWDLVPHGSASEALGYLIKIQGPITTTLASLDDGMLDEERPTHFGVPWPARRVLAVLIDEQLHHGAEIGVLRDLYRARFR
jgi:hypothetical protein